jgi:virginiamycin B lyase
MSIRKRSVLAGVFGMGLILVCLQVSAFAGDSESKLAAKPISGTGTIFGKVDAPQELKAAQVYIRNVDKNIVYMVYTTAGRYEAIDLLPGAYAVTIKKNGFSSDTKKLVIAAGVKTTADFSLQEAPLKPNHGDHPGYNSHEKQSASYEQLYPAGPGRALIEKTCMVCHGPDFIPSHQWSAEQWNEAIELMSDPNGLIKSRILPGTFSANDRQELVNYLVKYYGPDSDPRRLEVPEMPLDEKALATAMYVEYEVPKEYGSPIHDEHFDQEGNVWLVNRAAGRPSIDKLDPRTGAWKSYPIPDPHALPHGMTLDGSDDLWFAGETAFGRVDAKTGEMKLYYFDDKNSYIALPGIGVGKDTKHESHGHTPVVDSKQNIWMTLSYTDQLAKWDRRTQEISRFNVPTAHSFPYGAYADKKDNIWLAEWFRCKVAKFDPETEKFTEYSLPNPPCTVKRMSVDSKGTAWYVADGGTLGSIDPKTGKIFEYHAPVQYSSGYDVQPDSRDNLWISDSGQGGAILKFDRATKRFTYYPSVQMTDMPKLEVTRDGAIWYSARSASTKAVGVLYPDMTKIKTLGAYY